MLNNDQKITSTAIDNPSGYFFIIFLSMVYLSIMLCNAVLTNRYYNKIII